MQVKFPDFEVQITQEHIKDGEPLRTAALQALDLNIVEVLVGTIHVWIYKDEEDFARYTLDDSLIVWYEDFLRDMAQPATVVFANHRAYVKEEQNG